MHECAYRVERKKTEKGGERKRERRDQARFGESSHVNAIVNVMRIARKIKYRHGHSSLPFPQLTSSIEFRNSCTAYAGLFHSRVCRKEKKNSYFTNLLFRGKGRNKGRDIVEKKKKEKLIEGGEEKERKFPRWEQYESKFERIFWLIEFNGYNDS